MIPSISSVKNKNKKALKFSFLQLESLRAWHYQEGTTPPRNEKHRCAWGKKSYFGAGGRGALLIMPRPLLWCQIKAAIKGFLLRYRLLQCKHWFLPNFELKDFPELTFTPCTIEQKALSTCSLLCSNRSKKVYGQFGQSSMHHTFNFCPRPASKDSNVRHLKSS